MRHRMGFRKLGRTASHREAMLKNMVTSLIKHDRIKTTVPKAKELRKLADRCVTYAKHNTHSSRRRVYSIVRETGAVRKLMDEIGPRYIGRDGGYTRVIKTGYRKGDAADMAYIEFVAREGEIRRARPGRLSASTRHSKVESAE